MREGLLHPDLDTFWAGIICILTSWPVMMFSYPFDWKLCLFLWFIAGVFLADWQIAYEDEVPRGWWSY